NSKQKPKNGALTSSNDSIISSDLNSADYSHLTKHIRTDSFDEFFDKTLINAECADFGFCTEEYNDSTEFNLEKIKGSVKNNDKCQEKPSYNKGKECVK
ncbi:17073_t:CDS:1, partial [Cetraspora pellucida]